MRKFLLIMMMLVGFAVTSNAQVQWYRTTAFAQASVVNGRYYWGNWQQSNMNIAINLNTDVITVYSPVTQVYRVYGVYNNGNVYTDNSGGKNLKYYVIDQDGDKGEIRLRVERNGNSQIYVDFRDVGWVYNVVRTS